MKSLKTANTIAFIIVMINLIIVSLYDPTPVYFYFIIPIMVICAVISITYIMRLYSNSKNTEVNQYLSTIYHGGNCYYTGTAERFKIIIGRLFEDAPELIYMSAILNRITQKIITYHSAGYVELMDVAKATNGNFIDSNYERGYITTKGEFCNTKEALPIAIRNKQLITVLGDSATDVYPEDIWVM